MTVLMREMNQGKVAEIHLSGKLHSDDYATFVPELEKQIRRNGKLRVLVELGDFHGWDAGALWEDVKFDLKHFNDIERLAIVGEDKWEKGMAIFCKPFTSAEVRFYTHAQIAEARAWIEAGTV